MNSSVDLDTGFIDKAGLRTAVLLLNVRSLSIQELDSYWLSKYDRDTRRIKNSMTLLSSSGIAIIQDGVICISEACRDKLKEYQVDKVIETFILEYIDIRIYRIVFSATLLQEDTGFYTLRASSIPLFLSGLRDLLVNFGLLVRDSQSFTLTSSLASYLDDKGILEHTHSRRTKQISIDLFKDTLIQREHNGEFAEAIAMEYERLRLLGTEQEPVQVSTTDVARGYDIDSFEGQDSSQPDRYIEVKSVNLRFITFYLTANELRTAKNLGQSYYLYLVDISQGTDSIIIIRNAYTEAYSNPDIFLRSEELFKFSMVMGTRN